MYRLAVALFLMALVSLAGSALAEIPQLINYQGMLTDNGGNPLNETVSITFKLYNDSLSVSPGDKKWEETQAGIEVVNGLFNVTLGRVTALELDFSEDYWLDITVGAEHLPDRVRLTSVGYAYRAKTADNASIGGGWTDDGAYVRLTTSSDNVGIGTATPDAPLVISGDGSSWNRGFLFIKNDNNDAGIRLYDKADSVKHHIYNNNSGGDKLRIAPNGSYTSGGITIDQSGKVGAGTASPHSQLHVDGSVAVGYRLVGGNYTATASDCVIATGTDTYDVHVYLPSAVGIAGRVYTIKQVCGGIDTYVHPFGTQKIDDQTGPYVMIVAYEWVTIVSDGANWYIIGEDP
jgi:hypothetical protein